MSAELDLIVARLMGWEQFRNEFTWRPSPLSDLMVAGVESPACNFRPSTNDEGAGLVLDRIAALGWAATVFTCGWGGKTLIRCCIMRSPALPEYTVDVTADTRPLAICRVFIQAMERWGDG